MRHKFGVFGHLLLLDLFENREYAFYFGSIRFVGKLNNLRYLHLTCSVPSSDHLKRSMEALGSLLSEHGNLKTLALVNDPCHRNVVVRSA